MSLKALHLYDFVAPLYSDLFSFRRKRRSNLWLTKLKTKERRLFPPGAEDDSSATPGDLRPACTSLTSVIETPNDSAAQPFMTILNMLLRNEKPNSKLIKKEIIKKIAV
ncbi:hypothetical protein DPMN_086472 [Dreissena polymorpha]|uniref:Uncharacterized protein n=1 Tax=Dreissena polymorpha TaxID=45954 RepID=A0A9D4QVI4_DREPO|nr:hypothetical protein DPMN_086472 [Dreissena polymorpha]